MLALTLVVFAEKVFPRGQLASATIGFALVGLGLVGGRFDPLFYLLRRVRVAGHVGCLVRKQHPSRHPGQETYVSNTSPI